MNNIKISLHFIWYDFWVGFYWDKLKHTLYFCPLPMIVFKFVFKGGII
jgi:hypothetical protein